MGAEDDRVDATCNAAGADGARVLASDVCSNFWAPSFLWPNAIDAVRHVETGGLTTLVGAQSAAASWEVHTLTVKRSLLLCLSLSLTLLFSLPSPFRSNAVAGPTRRQPLDRLCQLQGGRTLPGPLPLLL